MKFTKSGQVLLASVVSLGVAATITACGTATSNTVDYVYVTNSKNTPGQIDVYLADGQSGVLVPIKDSPYPSGGTNPVAEVTSPDYKNLYVVNRGDAGDTGIVQFGIGSDAKLYAQHTSAPANVGTFPNSVAINAAGTLLFVTYKYQPGFTDANPGPGCIVVFPIAKGGALGDPIANGNLPYWPLTDPAHTGEIVNPVGVTVLPNGNSLYVASQNATTGLGEVSAFNVDSSGALTFIPNAITGGQTDDGNFAAGTAPTAIASEPRSAFVYVTDSVSNALISYVVQSSGVLIPATTNGPTRTDNFPVALTVDPRGKYLYVANYRASNISAFTIDQASGAPTGVASAGTYTTASLPDAVLVEPSLGRYVYTANFLDSTITGYHINPNDGTLTSVQNSPFPASGHPTAIAAIPHGNHSTQNVQN